MPDIFNREIAPVGGVFTSDKAIMTVATGGLAAAGFLLQGIRGQYTQQYRDIYELGSTNVYPNIGRSMGRLQIDRIVGVNGADLDESLFDACNVGATIDLTFDASGCAGIQGGRTYTFSGVTVINFGFSVTVEDNLIREQVELAFRAMSKS